MRETGRLRESTMSHPLPATVPRSVRAPLESAHCAARDSLAGESEPAHSGWYTVVAHSWKYLNIKREERHAISADDMRLSVTCKMIGWTVRRWD